MPTDRSMLVTAVGEVRDALEELATEMGVAGVAVGAAQIDRDAIGHLHPEEYASVALAVDRRQAEFATGRRLLRSLLSTDQPIPIGRAGRPVVPEGHSVSLAHDDDLAVAVALLGDDGRGLAVGVDLEHAGTFPGEVGALVLRPDESGIDPCLAFCAKEAAYKAWSASGGRFLEHHDVRVTVDGRRLSMRVLPDSVDVAGAWTTAAGRVVALAWMPPRLLGAPSDADAGA